MEDFLHGRFPAWETFYMGDFLHGRLFAWKTFRMGDFPYRDTNVQPSLINTIIYTIILIWIGWGYKAGV